MDIAADRQGLPKSGQSGIARRARSAWLNWAPAALGALVLVLGTGCAGTDTPSDATTAATQRATEMAAEVNRVRALAGLPPLTLDERLSQSAQAHSEDMAAHDYAAHVGLDGNTAADRARAMGYPARRLGENLQLGLETPQEAVAAWMDSPTHRDNVLRTQVGAMGVGYAFVPNDGGHARYRHYWTLVVATPWP